DKYRFSFSYPAQYLLELVNDDEWIIRNTERTWGIGFKIMHLQGKSYDSYVNSLSTSLFNALVKGYGLSATYDGTPYKNPYGKYLVGGFGFDLFLCSSPGSGSGLEKLANSWSLYLNIFRKTSHLSFVPDGIIIYDFRSPIDVDGHKLTKQVISSFEKTVVFKEAIVNKPVVTTVVKKKPVKTIPIVSKPIKTTPVVKKKPVTPPVVTPTITTNPVPKVPIVVKENIPAKKKGLYVFYGPLGKAGFKNELNEIVFEAVYSTHYVTWVRGFAALGKDNKWGFIDTTGKIVVPFIYEESKDFRDGFAAVKKDGKWGFINTLGDVVIPFYYGDARYFSEGYAAVASAREGEWGFIDITNTLKIDHRYEYAFDFSEGAAAVEIKGQWGYINKEGNYLFTEKFEKAGFFKNGKAEVKKDGVEYVIDKTGKRVD
ncbi:MAG: WG repeat-containing protein, partial [Chitinophagaceae bacterium]